MPLWDDEETTDSNRNSQAHLVNGNIRNVPSIRDASNSLQTWFIVIFISLIVILLAAIGAVIPVILTVTNQTTGLPIGIVLPYAGNPSNLIGIPYRWLLCDGSEISRSTYRDLFKVIGVTYGAGNGKDTFNLPDFRFRFPLGSNSSSDSLAAGGAAYHVLTLAEMAAHLHNVGTLATALAGGHSHGITDPTHNHGGGSTGTAVGGSGTANTFGASSNAFNILGTHSHTITAAATGITINSFPDHTHTLTGSTDTQGSSQAINMMPPYQTIHYIIRT